MKNDGVQIPRPLWFDLVNELRLRGQGRRESGAFLLALTGSKKVIRFVCYDDLDPTALDQGFIYFQSYGLSRLWDLCRENSLKVVADIHTHPGKIVKQSYIDKENPMVCDKGHLALIMPCYAVGNFKNLKQVGIYEYQGLHNWKTWSASSKKVYIDG